MQNLRKCLFLLLFLCLVVISLGRRAWAEGDVLTLDRALSMAREMNPTLLVAREQVEGAEAAVDEAQSAFGPKLEGSLSYTHYNEEPRNYVLGGTPGSYVMEGFEDTWQAALTLTQVLYSGGTLTANRAAARLRADALRATEARTLQGVENAVSNAYYQLQRARANLDVAEESVRLAKDHLTEVQALFKHGVVARNEVLRVQVDVSNAELSRIQAENSVKVAWKGLSRAVGFSFPEGTELPDPVEDVKTFPLPDDPESLALEQRPEMKALTFYRRAALRTAEAAAGQARPQVAFQGQARDVGDEFFPDVQDEWTLTLSATWTLYDHGEIKAQVSQARAQAREFLAQLSDMENQIVQEVATARLNMESSLKRLDVARNQVDLAEEDYRMALQRYRVQVGTNLDVLDARVALIDARTQRVSAVYDTYTAQADFLYALGRNGDVTTNEQ